MIALFLRQFRKDERGQPIVEFALVFPVFLMFIAGLFVYAWWFLGGVFLQDAAFEAARKYAVTQDTVEAEKIFRYPANRWGYVFVSPQSVRLSVSDDRSEATAVVRGEPKIKQFLFFSVPSIEKTAKVPLEYRFREPNAFDWWWR